MAPLPSLQSQLEPQAGPSSTSQEQTSHPQVIVQSASASESQDIQTNGFVQIEEGISQPDEIRGELAPPVRPYVSSRESRVSLPEEATRYFAAMGESPMPSPSTTHGFPPVRSNSRSPEKAGRSESPLKRGQAAYPEETSGSIQNPFDDESSHTRVDQDNNEFLDLDETDSTYDNSGRASAVESTEPEDLLDPQEGAIGPSLAKKDKKRAAVEDFPLPPTSPPVRPSIDSSTQSHMQQQQMQSMQRTRNGADSTSQLGATNGASRSGTELNGSISQSQSEMSQLSTASSTIPLADILPQATFRALPLLASDLPYTTIEVSNSSIRPNDRGKEVLSFIIAVNPGRGKEGWKVEKLYSDVLTLDSRVRGSIGKTMGKKLVSLPEGKLWKDHAPAKVDQRKVSIQFVSVSFLPFVVICNGRMRSLCTFHMWPLL